jgi:hypothetical protein
MSIPSMTSMNILGRKILTGRKALPVVNIVLGVLLGAMVLFFVRDILSLCPALKGGALPA